MADNKRRFRLTDLDLDFISLVAAGDDPAAQVVIAKAANCTCENYSGSERNAAGDRVCERCGLSVSKAQPDGMELGVDQPIGVIDEVSGSDRHYFEDDGEGNCAICGKPEHSSRHRISKGAPRKRPGRRGIPQHDGDNDGIIGEGTPWARPAGPKVPKALKRIGEIDDMGAKASRGFRTLPAHLKGKENDPQFARLVFQALRRNAENLMAKDRKGGKPLNQKKALDILAAMQEMERIHNLGMLGKPDRRGRGYNRKKPGGGINKADHSSRIHPGLDRKPGESNWVDAAGGLPSYIERIAKHLHYDRGMTISHAIATAVNRVKKWAAGVGNVNPDTRAKAAKAVAEWEAKKAKARLSKSGDDEFISFTLTNNNPPGRIHMTDISKDDLPEEVVDYIESLEASVDDLVAEVETLSKSQPVEKTGDEEKDFQALIAKADPEVAEVLKSQREAIKKAEDIAKAEREARLQREFIAKAEALPMLNDSTENLAALLRRAADALTPEDAAELEKVLKTANEQISKGNLFTEFGSAGGETTISKSVEAQAAELMKADPTLSKEQAITQVYEANPALYYESIKEG